MEYSFHVYNKLAADGVAMSMQKLLLARQTLQRMGAGLRSHTISRTHSHTISYPINTMPPALKESNPLPSSLQNTPPTQSLPFAPIKGRLPKKENPPVVVCIGSDLAIGDSLGPITGSMLKFKTQGIQVFIYGTLATPITAKEIAALRVFLKESHPNNPVIAIDAAVGAEGDVGLIKLHDRPLLPGTGANKRLGEIGDFSIMGIVAEKSVANYSLLNSTRLNLVYTMSEIISDGLASLLWELCGNKNAHKIV